MTVATQGRGTVRVLSVGTNVVHFPDGPTSLGIRNPFVLMIPPFPLIDVDARTPPIRSMIQWLPQRSEQTSSQNLGKRLFNSSFKGTRRIGLWFPAFSFVTTRVGEICFTRIFCKFDNFHLKF